MHKQKDYRQAMLAKIHIAAKEARICTNSLCRRLCFSELCPSCGAETREMSELDYRRFLFECTGLISCRYMNEAQMERVIRVFELAGFVPKRRGTLKEAMNASRLAMVRKIEAEAERFLGENWEARLRGYCRKVFGKDDLRFCSLKELRHIWGFMRRQEKKQKKKGGKVIYLLNDKRQEGGRR